MLLWIYSAEFSVNMTVRGKEKENENRPREPRMIVSPST